jgi:HSP20 family protein
MSIGNGERAYGSFPRIVHLPFRVDSDESPGAIQQRHLGNRASAAGRPAEENPDPCRPTLVEGVQACPRKCELWGQQVPQTVASGQRPAPRPVFLPPADIYETHDSIVVRAEMPGVAPDGLDITLERRVLTIRGRSAISDHAGYHRVYNEYADGDYERVFTLSENIDGIASRPRLKDRVLNLVFPKAESVPKENRT